MIKPLKKKYPFRLLPVIILFAASTGIKAQVKPEFRGVWVATVDNIDWPSKGNFNADSQKVEFIKLLDMHKAIGMNAMVVQVRPSTDAFYPSQYEPWSEWLTGTQGKPPSPYYDPLAFMIEETHKRGMQFHAWMNPYRAEFKIGSSSISATHITKLHPDWFLTYGDKRFFDPGSKEVMQYVTNVVTDVVRRYDVDAVHFDDYFYPYRIAGKEFPDDVNYKRYGNGINKEDWRRNNTDSIIRMLSVAIKKVNPKCQFGISPFGVWRNADKDPDGSNTRAGQTNYDDLYADILLWLRNKWIDYVAPQLYWEFGHKAAPYEVLVKWWGEHTYGRNCYIGLGIYRAGSNAAWKDDTQIPRMIETLRNTPNIQGMIFFSSKTFEKNPNGWNDSLRLNYFKDPAPAPSLAISANKPLIRVTGTSSYGNALMLSISDPGSPGNYDSLFVYNIVNKNETISDSKMWRKLTLSGGKTQVTIPYFRQRDETYAFAFKNKQGLYSDFAYLEDFVRNP